ncbi:MAG: SDR family oxidoreductase [Lachnospiraceae bacterium]|nr:SDR family oxidoreductase [Lachnospiraceae bacterium]
MKILVTGSNGFIAKNLIVELRSRGYEDLMLCNRDTSMEELERYIEKCDVLVHLAGVNRPLREEEYYIENVVFTEKLIKLLENNHKKICMLFSSTIHTGRHKCYEESKQQGEKILQEYARESGSSLFIFRLPNVFGKWCRPNYNSVVATFCYNVSHGLDIKVNDPDARMNLVYIDDVVNEFISCVDRGSEAASEYVEISQSYQTTVGEVAQAIMSFKQGREQLEMPYVGNPLLKRLYSTYLSYMEPEAYRYELKMNIDARGSFTEFLRSQNFGQVSVNVAKPGVVKGNHWHHTKVEKFLVVKGKASIKFRHIITGRVIEYIVSDQKLEVVDIPVGYTHNIMNIGTEDLVTIIWANETFDKDRPDTYYEEV